MNAKKEMSPEEIKKASLEKLEVIRYYTQEKYLGSYIVNGSRYDLHMDKIDSLGFQDRLESLEWLEVLKIAAENIKREVERVEREEERKKNVIQDLLDEITAISEEGEYTVKHPKFGDVTFKIDKEGYHGSWLGFRNKRILLSLVLYDLTANQDRY